MTELCNSAITRGETIHSRFIQWVLKSSFIFIKFVNSNRQSENPMLYMSNIALFGEILRIVPVNKFQEYLFLKFCLPRIVSPTCYLKSKLSKGYYD